MIFNKTIRVFHTMQGKRACFKTLKVQLKLLSCLGNQLKDTTSEKQSFGCDEIDQFRNCKAGSAMTDTCCFCRELEFAPPLPHEVTHNCL